MHRLVLAAAVLALTAACGSSGPAGDDPPSDAPTPATTASSTPGAADDPAPAGLVLSPGRVGPVAAGMTQAEAAATGYFDTDVDVGEEPCTRTEPLHWKAPYDEQIDVQTTADGTIVSMGVLRNPTLATDKGIRIGSTLAEVNGAYGDGVSPAMEAGYGQAGVYVNEADDWLGLLFDAAFADVDETSQVIFMEVTRGDRPGLLRDGC